MVPPCHVADQERKQGKQKRDHTNSREIHEAVHHHLADPPSALTDCVAAEQVLTRPMQLHLAPSGLALPAKKVSHVAIRANVANWS